MTNFNFKYTDPNHDPRVAAVKWRQQIDLGNGQITPGKKDTDADLKHWEMTPDLFEGKSVIDIGACDGCFSFYAEKSGATSVLAVDPYGWGSQELDEKSKQEIWSQQEGFLLAKEILESKVEDSVVPLEEISPETVGEHDVALFLGVFYHLPNPLAILDKVVSVAKETVVVETINAEYHSWRRKWPLPAREDGSSEPIMIYYPGNEVDGDYTTYWSCNIQLLEQYLATKGFTKFKSKRIYSGSRIITYATR